MNNLKKSNVENHTCYYFDDIIQIEDFDFENILLDQKLYKNILFNDISYETFIGAKPLRVRFHKVDRFFRVYDETKYLVLLGPEKYDAIYNRIRYLIIQKSGIRYVFFS